MVLGRESNVVAVMMMYGFLADVIEELVPWKGKERLCKSAISWREGCASRLIERIDKMAYEMKHPTSTASEEKKVMGMGLVKVVQSEYKLNYDSLYGHGAYARMKQQQKQYEVKKAEEPKKELTKEEKEKQAKASDKWWKKYERQQQREIEKRDLSAFMMGRKTAETISLQDRIV